MAAPGEWFPQGFAQSVLQIANSVKAREAELAEMRSQRAARNFLDQQRLALQQRGRDIQAAASGQGGGSNEYDAERARVLREEATLRRDGLIAKSIADLKDKGSAFFGPGSEKALADFLTAEGKTGAPAAQEGTLGPQGPEKLPRPRYHQIRVGSGVMVIRTGGPEYEKLELEQQKLQQEVANEHQKGLNLQTLNDLRQLRLQEGYQALGSGNSKRLSVNLSTYTRQIEEKRKDLQNQMQAALNMDNLKGYNDARDALKAIDEDPASALPSDQRGTYKQSVELHALALKRDNEFMRAQEGLRSPTEAVREASRKTINQLVPGFGTYDRDRMKNAGYSKAAADDPVSIATRLAPDAPWTRLPVTTTFGSSTKGAPQGEYYYLEGDGWVPLNRQAVELSRTGFFKGKIAKASRLLGWRPTKQKQPAPEPEPTPDTEVATPEDATAAAVTARIEADKQRIIQIRRELTDLPENDPRREELLDEITAIVQRNPQ